MLRNLKNVPIVYDEDSPELTDEQLAKFYRPTKNHTAVISKEIDFSKGLTEEQRAMLREMEASPIVYDEDCPELTDEQLAKFRRVAGTDRDKRRQEQDIQTVTVSLSPRAMAKARSLGSDCTAVLSRILEAALADNETLRHYL